MRPETHSPNGIEPRPGGWDSSRILPYAHRNDPMVLEGGLFVAANGCTSATGGLTGSVSDARFTPLRAQRVVDRIARAQEVDAVELLDLAR